MSNVSNKKIKLGITIGDLNGIGLEVILKSLLDNRILEHCTPIVYGSAKATAFHRKALHIQDFSFNIINSVEQANPKRSNLLICWEEEVKIELGLDTKEGGKYALRSLEMATNDLLAGKIDAVVTAPINKHNIQDANFHFPGHTEYFQDRSKSKESLMFLLSEDMRIGMVTGHVPLNKVSENISVEKILTKLNIMNESLKNDFWIEKPRIAVLGLNPHSGDNGLIGKEEIDIIAPAIAEAKKKKIMAFGPFPADGFFGSGMYKKYDAVLAMYHDQGLIPFKMLSFGQGVNYTAGLPIVRTSPDHGTGYDIAGKNMADASSFRTAMYTAIDIVRHRTEQSNLKSNALVPGQLKLKTTKYDSEE